MTDDWPIQTEVRETRNPAVDEVVIDGERVATISATKFPSIGWVPTAQWGRDKEIAFPGKAWADVIEWIEGKYRERGKSVTLYMTPDQELLVRSYLEAIKANRLEVPK